MSTEQNNINESAKKDRIVIDPLLSYYFNEVQDSIKKIVLLPPYNMPEDELDEFISRFFFNQYIDAKEIRDIVNDSFVKEEEYHECAYRILNVHYRKYYNNFLASKGEEAAFVIEKKKFVGYQEFINEGIVSNDGGNGFMILIQLLGEMGMKFIKPKDKRYLNTGDFNVFFYTSTINNYSELSDELEQRKSLSTTFNTFKSQSNTKDMSFYFSVKDFILDYGFYDINNHKITATGRFKMDSSLLKKMCNFASTSMITDVLSNNNINNLVFLGKVRAEFRDFLAESKPVIVVSNKIVVKKFVVTDFKNTATTHEQYLSFFANWVLKKRWNNRINYYVDLDGTSDSQEVKFYIKIK